MPGFWTKTKGGHTIHVNGDPNMSEKTLTAICDLADAARQPDWDNAPEWAQWWAIDEDNTAWWYENKPAAKLKLGFWKSDFGKFEFFEFTEPLSDWQQSLLQRPTKYKESE